MDVATVTPRVLRIPVIIPPTPVPLPGVAIKLTISGPQYYTEKTWVGSASKGTTVEAAFEALRLFATPFQGGGRISQTGDQTNIPGFGPVQHIVDTDRYTIINTALPGHALYPGNVFRKIVQDGDDIYVVTEKYGQGIFPTLNQLVAPFLWGAVDRNIRNSLNSSPSSSSKSGSTFAEISKDDSGREILTTGIVLPNSTVLGRQGPASISGNTASFGSSDSRVLLRHPAGTSIQYPLINGQLDMAPNGNSNITIAGVNGAPARKIILDQASGAIAFSTGASPGPSHSLPAGSLVTVEPTNTINTTEFDNGNIRSRSWRNTVLDSQNRPIKIADTPDSGRIGWSDAQVQQFWSQYNGNGRPIGEPVQRVVAPNGAPPAQQPRVSAGQAIGSDPGSALGQAPIPARAPRSGQAADPGNAIPADNATPAPAPEDGSAAAAAPPADGVEAEQAGNEGNRAAADRQQAVAAHLARIDQAKRRIPDFDQVIRSGGRVQVAPDVADEILNSEKSALLQYHLAGNPSKLDELNGLSGKNLAREIGRLESRLYLPTARTVTEASPPLSDVQGFAAPVFDPHTTDDMDAFASWLREDQARRRRA